MQVLIGLRKPSRYRPTLTSLFREAENTSSRASAKFTFKKIRRAVSRTVVDNQKTEVCIAAQKRPYLRCCLQGCFTLISYWKDNQNTLHESLLSVYI